MTTFLESLRNGNVNDARQLFTADHGLAQTRGEDGVSAILLARYMGHQDFAREMADTHPAIDLFEAAALGDLHRTREILAETPTSVNEFNVDGFTPLGLAAYFGHLEEAQLLLNNGADPNIGSENALDVMPLHSALGGNHFALAQLLIENGSEVNEPTGDDWTPLHYVAELNSIELAKLLIKAGARTGYPRKSDGKTALEVAEDKGYKDLAALIAETAETA